MDIVRKIGPLAGRILLAIVFIVAGFGKLTGFEGTVGYIQSVGMPMPMVMAVIAIIIELGGGIMIAVGFKARIGAAALFVFVLVASLVFHQFWAVPAEQVQLQSIMFMKNLAIMGGMLYIVVHGSGPLSIDRNP